MILDTTSYWEAITYCLILYSGMFLHDRMYFMLKRIQQTYRWLQEAVLLYLRVSLLTQN